MRRLLFSAYTFGRAIEPTILVLRWPDQDWRTSYCWTYWWWSWYHQYQAGDGSINTYVTVTLSQGVEGLDVDTTFIVNGVIDSDFNGIMFKRFWVSSDGDTPSPIRFPIFPSMHFLNWSYRHLDTDTVTSTSPYIFNTSLRSVYGMCTSIHDGSGPLDLSPWLWTIHGVSLQKDDTISKFNQTTGGFDDSSTVDNLHSDPTYLQCLLL